MLWGCLRIWRISVNGAENGGACDRRLCQGSKSPVTWCYSTGSGKSVRSMKRKKKGKNFGKKTEMDMLVCKWGKSRYESWCETCFRFSRLGLTTQELHACLAKLALPFNTSSALKQVGYMRVTQVTGFLKPLMLQFCELFNSTVSFLVGLIIGYSTAARWIIIPPEKYWDFFTSLQGISKFAVLRGYRKTKLPTQRPPQIAPQSSSILKATVLKLLG